RPVLVVERARERPLRAFVTQHGVGRGIERAAPFVVGLGDGREVRRDDGVLRKQRLPRALQVFDALHVASRFLGELGGYDAGGYEQCGGGGFQQRTAFHRAAPVLRGRAIGRGRCHYRSARPSRRVGTARRLLTRA